MQRTRLTWEQWYNLACQYAKEYRSLDNIQRNYETKEGYKLGFWINTQRTAYKNRIIPKEERKNAFSPLTDEQVSKLETIGMVWVPKLTWEEWYELAIDYAKEYGSLANIPERYVTKKNYKLGIWVQTQRTAYKNRNMPKEARTSNLSPLNDEQVSKLEEIGMEWGPKLTWDEWYELAFIYAKEHGSLAKIQVGYITNEGYKLGFWIKTQRESYKNRTIPKEGRKNTYLPLTDEQVSKLEAIGMIWSVRKNKNDIKYICERYGINYSKNCEILERLSVKIFEAKIAFCKERNINLTANGYLSYIFTLSNVDFELEYGISIGDLITKYNEKQQLKLDNYIMPRAQLSWEEWYNLACVYVKEHGSIALIKATYKTKDGYKLGKWISNQRQAYKYRTIPKEERKNRFLPLTDEHVSKLEDIGMDWNPQLTWEEWYDLAIDYAKEHGSIANIKVSYITKEGYKLGIWIQTQRTAYKYRIIPKEERTNLSLPLTDNQVYKLMEIGMEWAPKLIWEEWYELAIQYAKEHGSLANIKEKYETREGHKLGVWIHNQRVAYKNRTIPKEGRKNASLPLTDDQVFKLEKIGMVWDVKKNTNHIKYLCEKYNINYLKESALLKRIPIKILEAKIAFCKDRNISLTVNGFLNYIFVMSHIDFELEYGISIDDLITKYSETQNLKLNN